MPKRSVAADGQHSAPVATVDAVRPILKWAGGKRQLLPALRRYYPDRFGRYFEPFLGSGAVFLDLHNLGLLDLKGGRRVYLSDINADIIGCYRSVRDYPAQVVHHLRVLERDWRTGGSAHFYEIRDRAFNPARRAVFEAPNPAAAYTPELAAMLIYLNRTGFNGLFRVNRAGEFNVPVGRYAKPRILDEAHLRQVAAALRSRGVTLVQASFERALLDAGKGDFIYCDPPYAPVSRTACFANYTATGFTLADQKRLQEALIGAATRGAHVVLSNSSAPDIVELYSTDAAHRAMLRIERIQARRAINSRADSRGPVTELVITNVVKRKMLRAYAPAIQTSVRQLGHANARRRSDSKET